MKLRKIGYFLLFIFAAAISMYSFLLLYENTHILKYIEDIATKKLFIEHTLLFAGFYLVLKIVKKSRIRIICIILISAVYLYLHQAITALITDGIFIAALIGLGEILLIRVRKKHTEESGISRYLNSFMIGSLTYIISVCILSAMQTASIRLVRYYTFFLVVAVILIYTLLRVFKIIVPVQNHSDNTDKAENKNYICLGFAIMLSALLLQLGRINIALDYDSLRYGLRSMSVLVGNTGIYDRLGTVNDVYVYPKGLEILTLALNTEKSFGFVLSFNYLCAVLALFAIYEIVIVCSEKVDGNSINKGWLAAVFVSVTPAIMNMSISAKTDMITLLMQLISVLNMCLYIRKRQNYYMIFALAALLASLIYKPTSLLFSLGIGISNIIYLLLDYFKRKNTVKNIFDFSYLLIYPVFAIVAVYARTYMLTGHIITSVYSSIWYKLGIETKYPYTIGIYKSAGMNMSSGEGVDIVYRLFQLLVAPTKEVHIYIASPTVLIIVLLVPAVIFAVKFCFKNRENKDVFLYLTALLTVDVMVSLLSLFVLNQVDGNYFILLFSLIIIMLCFLVEADSVRYLFNATLPCIIFAFIILGVTNWAGVNGLSESPKDTKDFGIYNHHDRYLNKEAVEKHEFVDVYNDLKELGNPRTLLLSDDNSLLALGSDIRTYTDITGSGGNAAVVKTLEHFKKYLDYSKVKYICVEDEFLKDRQRASDVVKYMLEEGSTEVYKDYGNIVLYKVTVGTD